MGRTRVPTRDTTFAADQHHRTHIRPRLRQPFRILQHRHITFLVATVTVFHRGHHLTTRERILTRLLERAPDRFVERGLIPFDGHQVIPAPIPNLPDDLRLATRGINRHHRAGQVESRHEVGDRRDLVPALRHTPGTADEAVLDGPRIDHMPAPGERVLRGTPGALAIDGHVNRTGRCARGFHPPTEPIREGIGCEFDEDALEGVVAGNAIGYVEEPSEELVLGASIFGDLFPAVGPADHRAGRDDEDVHQLVKRVGGLHPGIGQIGEDGGQWKRHGVSS